MYELNKDVGKVLGVDNPTVMKKIGSLQEKIVCDYFEEGITGVEIDVGFGTLTVSINNEEDTMRWKFTPSKRLERNVLKVINGYDSDILPQTLGKEWVNRMIKELGGDEQ